jgi:hypothetical protein
MDERIFDERGAASYLGGDASSLQPRVLADWRYQQRGPRFFRIGGAIRYAQSDLDEFRQAQAITPRRPHCEPPSRARRLSPEQRAAISKRYASGLVSMRVLATEFNVSTTTISIIVRDVVIAPDAPRRQGPLHKARSRGPPGATATAPVQSAN